MGAFCCHGNQRFDPFCPKTLRFKYTTKFSLPKIACPAIVYVEIVAVIDPFFVGVCLAIKVYCYNPTEICQQRLQGVQNVAQKLCSWERSFMQPFPHPNDATHKIWSRLANWLQRYSSSKVWNFRHSRASDFKMSGLIRPKIELDRAFMPVLVTSNCWWFDQKYELAWRHHFPIISLWEIV